jgi:hypothetical protein
MRSTGIYAISTTLGEAVRAFAPHALPPPKPALAPECFVEANRVAELALARLLGWRGWCPLWIGCFTAPFAKRRC